MTKPPPVNREDTRPRLRQRLPNLPRLLAHPGKDRALEQNGRLNGLTDFPAFSLLFSEAVDDDKVDKRGIKAALAVLILAGLALLLMVLQGFWREALFG